jgi:TP901 family phage tail tape measure protein
MQGSVAGLAGATAAANATMERSFARTSETMLDVSKKAAVISAAILVPLGLATKAAVDFEDRLADVGKTTGLSGVELEGFGKELLAISRTTRSSINELLDIGIVGGQLGVARNELVAFTKAADVFNIALGKDFAGGTEEAVASVSKIRNLFKDTRGLNISESISRTGSAINDLGASGEATTQNINDFVTRIGSMPNAMKSTFKEMAGLGAFLEASGVNSERGSSGFTNLMVEINKHLPQFARHLKMTTKDAAALFNTKPLVFAQKFARSLNGMDNQKAQKVMTDLSLNSTEVLRVVGALGDETDKFTDYLNISSSAFELNNSLTLEAARKKATLAGKLQTLKNGFAELAIAVGDILLPVMAKMTTVITKVANIVTDWTRKHPTLTKVIVYTALALGILSAAIAVNTFVIGQLLKIKVLWTAAIWAVEFAQGVLAVTTGTLNGTLLASAAASKGAAFGMTMFGNSVAATLGKLALLIAALVYINELKKDFDKKTPLQKEIERENSWQNLGMGSPRTPIMDRLKKQGFNERQIDSIANTGIFDPFSKFEQGVFEKYKNVTPMTPEQVLERNNTVQPAVNPKASTEELLKSVIELNKKETVSVNFGNLPKGTDVQHSKGIAVNFSSTQVMPA